MRWVRCGLHLGWIALLVEVHRRGEVGLHRRLHLVLLRVPPLLCAEGRDRHRVLHRQLLMLHVLHRRLHLLLHGLVRRLMLDALHGRGAHAVGLPLPRHAGHLAWRPDGVL